MTSTNLSVLRAVAERVIPADANGSGISGSIALPHVLRELAVGGAMSGFQTPLSDLLTRINDEAPGGDFTALSAEAQDEWLYRYEQDLHTRPAFYRMVELITEGFYTTEEGMAMVGFAPVKEVLP